VPHYGLFSRLLLRPSSKYSPQDPVLKSPHSSLIEKDRVSGTAKKELAVGGGGGENELRPKILQAFARIQWSLITLPWKQSHHCSVDLIGCCTPDNNESEEWRLLGCYAVWLL
jgi:hypothetical protein